MKNLLQAENISLQIADRKICRDLNFTLQPGDICGVLGPNGSGKTTLLHMLAGLISPQQGSVYLNQINLASLSPKQIARQLGILFQDTVNTFPQTVFEYCLNGRYPHQSYFGFETVDDIDRVEKALTVMHLITKKNQDCQTLSGGERRRLAIATLLAQAPTVYLLDEPTNHLDIAHQIKLLNYFKQLASEQSLGIILSLHDINLANYYCNKLLMLYDNTEVVFGPTKQILTTETISRLYQHSFIEVNNTWQYVY